MKHTADSESDDLPTGMGAPAARALSAAGITRLKQLTSISEAELLKLHGVGPKAIRILRAALAERGLSFAAAAKSRAASAADHARISRRAGNK